MFQVVFISHFLLTTQMWENKVYTNIMISYSYFSSLASNTIGQKKFNYKQLRRDSMKIFGGGGGLRLFLWLRVCIIPCSGLWHRIVRYKLSNALEKPTLELEAVVLYAVSVYLYKATWFHVSEIFSHIYFEENASLCSLVQAFAVSVMKLTLLPAMKTQRKVGYIDLLFI